METKTKKLALIGSLMLLVCLAAIFIFIVFKIIEFKTNENKETENSEEKKVVLNFNSKEKTKEQNNPKEESRIYPVERNSNDTKNAAGAAGDATIAIKAKDSSGMPATGLKCQLSVVKKNPDIITSSLTIDETDSNGECTFYELKPNSRYWVELYNEANRTYRQFIEISDVSPGDRIEKDMIILQDELSNPDSSETSPNQSKIPCDDSDDGINYNVRGETAGVTRCIIDNLIQDCPDGIKSLKDTCAQGEYDLKQYGKNPMLIEYFCDSDGRVNMKGYLCPKGCFNGVCKKK